MDPLKMFFVLKQKITRLGCPADTKKNRIFFICAQITHPLYYDKGSGPSPKPHSR